MVGEEVPAPSARCAADARDWQVLFRRSKLPLERRRIRWGRRPANSRCDSRKSRFNSATYTTSHILESLRHTYHCNGLCSITTHLMGESTSYAQTETAEDDPVPDEQLLNWAMEEEDAYDLENTGVEVVSGYYD